MTDTPLPGGPFSAEVPRSVVLSREELLVILTLTNRTFPELSAEPLGEVSDEQRAYGLIVAERALRARGLALIDPKGKLRIDRNVLRLVLGCTAFEEKVIITRVASPEGIGAQLSAHRYDGAWLIHYEASPGLHAFHEAATWEAAWKALEGYLDYPAQTAVEPLSLSVAERVIEAARAAADRGDRARIEQTLTQAGVPASAGAQLAGFLAEPHIITLYQIVRPVGADAALQTISTLHDAEALYMAISIEGPESPVVIQSVAPEAVYESVAHALTILLNAGPTTE